MFDTQKEVKRKFRKLVSTYFIFFGIVVSSSELPVIDFDVTQFIDEFNCGKPFNLDKGNIDFLHKYCPDQAPDNLTECESMELSLSSTVPPLDNFNYFCPSGFPQDLNNMHFENESAYRQGYYLPCSYTPREATKSLPSANYNGQNDIYTQFYMEYMYLSNNEEKQNCGTPTFATENERFSLKRLVERHDLINCPKKKIRGLINDIPSSSFSQEGGERFNTKIWSHINGIEHFEKVAISFNSPICKKYFPNDFLCLDCLKSISIDGKSSISCLTEILNVKFLFCHYMRNLKKTLLRLEDVKPEISSDPQILKMLFYEIEDIQKKNHSMKNELNLLKVKNKFSEKCFIKILRKVKASWTSLYYIL